MTFWGIDLSATRVAVAQLGANLPASRIYDAGSVKREDHEERIGRACRIAGALNEMLRPFDADRVIAIEEGWSGQIMGGRVTCYQTGEVFGLCLRVVTSHCAGGWFLVNPNYVAEFATGFSKRSPKGGKDCIRLAVSKKWDFEADTNDEVDAFVMAQIARCSQEPEGFTVQQRETVAKCFLSQGKSPRPMNVHFAHRPAWLPPLPEKPEPKRRKVKPPDPPDVAVSAPRTRRRLAAGLSAAETRTDGLFAREGQVR